MSRRPLKHELRAGSLHTPVQRPRRKSGSAPLEVLEARRKAPVSSNSARSFSLAWDETEALGITADMRRSGPGMLSDQERKETLYKAYLNSTWISACVDVIAKRITSGGFILEETKQGQGNQEHWQDLDALLHYINEDEDFLQLIRSIATDLLIYGEAYMEIVSKDGKPYQLHKIDCQTMSYQLDIHGHIIKYVQNMTHTVESVEFAPDEVIRWWFPDPKAAKKALSPIERILGPVDASTHMADWIRAFFRKGARPPFWIKFPGPRAEAERFIVWLRENYTGQANAHIPMILYDDAELFEVGKGAIDIDFAKGLDQMCKEILAAYQVPPATVGLIESGNIGGGTGESQEKSFQFNACDPLRQLIFEKFNFRVVVRGFGFTDYVVNTRYADYRSDEQISQIQDRRIRNGSLTINEVREEIGKQPVEGGDEAIVAITKEILPVQRLEELADEQRQQQAVALEQQKANAELAQVKADDAKNPPPAPASVGGPSTSGTQPGAPAAPTAPPAENGEGTPAESAGRPAMLTEHTGVMVALFLDQEAAAALALPGGEPASALHVTLAFLGDTRDLGPGDVERLRYAVARFASECPPLEGRTSGLGHFTQDDAEALEPLYASVDIPGLSAWREWLLEFLTQSGFSASQQHGFVPHITLDYLAPDTPTPDIRVPELPLRFGAISLAVGNDRYDFPLSGAHEEEQPTQERWDGAGRATGAGVSRAFPENHESMVLASQSALEKQVASLFTGIAQRGQKTLLGTQGGTHGH